MSGARKVFLFDARGYPKHIDVSRSVTARVGKLSGVNVAVLFSFARSIVHDENSFRKPNATHPVANYPGSVIN